MFWYKLATRLRLAGVVLLCSVILLFIMALGYSPFPFEQDKEFYLYSPSSQAQITTTPTVYDLLYVKGERAKSLSESVDELLIRYGAKIVFTEEFDGGTSYYCYSSKLQTPIVIDGKFVNLHIVDRASERTVGTPIIFGGY